MARFYTGKLSRPLEADHPFAFVVNAAGFSGVAPPLGEWQVPNPLNHAGQVGDHVVAMQHVTAPETCLVLSVGAALPPAEEADPAAPPPAAEAATDVSGDPVNDKPKASRD